MSEELKDKIIKQIEVEKPYSPWRFWVTEWLRYFVIFMLLIGAALSLAFFVWDTLEINEILGVDRMDIGALLIRGLPEILLLVVIFSIILYLLYRQTDLPFVKNRVLVFCSLWVIMIAITAGFVVYVKNNRSVALVFFQTQNQLEKLPYRHERAMNLYRDDRPKNIFTGRIISIVPNLDPQRIEYVLVVENRFEQKEFIADFKLLNDVGVGDHVSILLAGDNGSRVIGIKKLPPKPFNPLFKPEIQIQIQF